LLTASALKCAAAFGNDVLVAQALSVAADMIGLRLGAATIIMIANAAMISIDFFNAASIKAAFL